MVLFVSLFIGETYAFSVSLSEDRGVDDSPLVFDNVLYNQQGVYK